MGPLKLKGTGEFKNQFPLCISEGRRIKGALQQFLKVLQHNLPAAGNNLILSQFSSEAIEENLWVPRSPPWGSVRLEEEHWDLRQVQGQGVILSTWRRHLGCSPQAKDLGKSQTALLWESSATEGGFRMLNMLQKGMKAAFVDLVNQTMELKSPTTYTNAVISLDLIFPLTDPNTEFQTLKKVGKTELYPCYSKQAG